MKLDLKEWINKVASFIDKNKVRTTTFTGTTNGNGAVNLSSIIPITANIIAIETSSNVNALCIPWIYNKSYWFVSVVRWETLSTTAFANTSFTFTIRYIVGGVLRSPLISRLLAIFKTGGGVDEARCEGIDSKAPESRNRDILDQYGRRAILEVWKSGHASMASSRKRQRDHNDNRSAITIRILSYVPVLRHLGGCQSAILERLVDIQQAVGHKCLLWKPNIYSSLTPERGWAV